MNPPPDAMLERLSILRGTVCLENFRSSSSLADITQARARAVWAIYQLAYGSASGTLLESTTRLPRKTLQNIISTGHLPARWAAPFDLAFQNARQLVRLATLNKYE